MATGPTDESDCLPHCIVELRGGLVLLAGRLLLCNHAAVLPTIPGEVAADDVAQRQDGAVVILKGT